MSQLDISAPPGERVARTFPRRRRPRPFLADLVSSPVSLKWIMALSGIAGMGFILFHMIGNLHLYEGPRQVNHYAETLRGLGGGLAPRGFVLWAMRLGLLAALLIHVLAAWRLTVVNFRARPERYRSRRDYIAADYASRTMRLSGVWMGFFILYHLADLTGGKLNPEFIPGDPYHNVVESFSNPVVASFYVISMGFLGLHLFHGAWSIFQSLGINNPRYNSWRRGFAATFAAVVVAGNMSFPLAVQAGLISEDTRCWPTADQVEFLREAGSSVEAEEATLRQQGLTFCDVVDQIPTSMEEYEEQLLEQEEQQLELQQQLEDQMAPLDTAPTDTAPRTSGDQTP